MITKIPTGLEYIKMIASFGEEISRDSVPYLANHKDDLDVLGTALSIFYITATCHRKCQGGSHVLESLVARAYNLALSAELCPKVVRGVKSRGYLVVNKRFNMRMQCILYRN